MYFMDSKYPGTASGFVFKTEMNDEVSADLIGD